MSNRPFEVNYTPDVGLIPKFNPSGLNLVPGATHKHFEVANKELLLVFRSFVDEAIEVKVMDAAEDLDEE